MFSASVASLGWLDSGHIRGRDKFEFSVSSIIRMINYKLRPLWQQIFVNQNGIGQRGLASNQDPIRCGPIFSATLNHYIYTYRAICHAICNLSQRNMKQVYARCSSNVLCNSCDVVSTSNIVWRWFGTGHTHAAFFGHVVLRAFF